MAFSIVQTLTVVYTFQTPLPWRAFLVTADPCIAGVTLLALARRMVTVSVSTLADFRAVLTEIWHLTLLRARRTFVARLTVTMSVQSVTTEIHIKNRHCVVFFLFDFNHFSVIMSNFQYTDPFFFVKNMYYYNELWL